MTGNDLRQRFKRLFQYQPLPFFPYTDVWYWKRWATLVGYTFVCTLTAAATLGVLLWLH